VTEPSSESTYDCIIIGGGPAGLTCAIFLGRYRRRVLLLDTGEPRNYASRGIHGFLGQHSIPPGELLQRGRAEAESVGVELRGSRATAVERVGELFEVTTSDGVVRARRIVLAYGVRDLKPDLPRFEQLYGRGIHHCPDCDGYEVSDKRVGVIGNGKRAAGLALTMLQWTDDVRIFTNGAPRDLDDEQKSKLLAESIDVREEKILELIEEQERLAAVVLENGERIEVDALFFSIGVERSCDLAERLGCKVDPTKPDIVVDEHRRTSVEGVWAIGDLVPGSQLAITSAADGAIAAIDINKTLVQPARKMKS
jgi:thioredoxin reductase